MESEVKGKTVLVRCDLNVTGDLVVFDDARLRGNLPTILHLCQKGAKVLVCGHRADRLSLKPVAKRMGDLIGKDIKCAPDCKATDKVKSMVRAMAEGDAMMLENTRFHKGEFENNQDLASSMACLADLFVNDALGAAHHAHASTVGVTRYLKPCVSGLSLKQELDYLVSIADKPGRPMAAIVGSSRLSKQVHVIWSLLRTVNKLFIGGGMAFTFLKALGFSVGSSPVEEDFVDIANHMMTVAHWTGVELILPKDFACAKPHPTCSKRSSTRGFRVASALEFPDGWQGMDNGPEANADWKASLADCKTVICIGSLGHGESQCRGFGRSSIEMAGCLAELTEKNGATTIIAGGGAAKTVHVADLTLKMSHVSTGDSSSMRILGAGKFRPALLPALLPALHVLDRTDGGSETEEGGSAPFAEDRLPHLRTLGATPKSMAPSSKRRKREED